MQVERVKYGRALARVERDLNRVIDAINGNRIASAPGYRIKGTSNGTALDILFPKATAVTASSVQQFKITVIADDYITAREWDGTTLGATKNIAKPWRLRKTGWNGVTVSYDFNGTSVPIQYTYLTRPGFRTARNTLTNTTENQAIIALYAVNDLIQATEPIGGTQVTVDGSELTWLDLNVDARAWARY